MIKFNRIIAAVIICLGLLTISINIVLVYFTNNNENKYYMIEINRAHNEIKENNYSANIDLSRYQYLKDISFLPANFGSDNFGSDEIKKFFENDNNAYLIKPIGDKEITGYIKFSYTPGANTNGSNVIMIVNLCIGLMSIFIIAILFYIKKQIIKPFNEIREMPFALSKGHLTQGIKESKSRYFGRFLWGLNLLRENLEEHKTKELALTKEKKTIVLSISHDIKTPLSAIKLYTKALSENLYDNEEKRQKIIDGIEGKADEIESFVQDIIKTSKEDFLHIDVRNSEFYLGDLIERLRLYYSDKLDYLKCQFTVQSFENCLIYGDIERGLEVFENIIENAIKYGDGKQITLGFDCEENFQLVSVKNTGNTLPANEMVHLWDSFWRGSNVKDKKGSGLGLYICRQIMTQMKGDIYAAAENEDMCITVVLKKL